MANGRFRHYYWQIMTIVAKHNEIVTITSSSSEDEADYAGRFDFRLTFNDGSYFIAISSLMSNGDVIEHTYYYCYKNPNDIRVFSYDDKPHHPAIPTHPHHMHIGSDDTDENLAYSCDLSPINFFSVFQKICSIYFVA